MSLLTEPPRVRLGWSPELDEAFAPHAEQGLVPARVTIQNRGLYVVSGDDGELEAEPTGRLRHDAGAGGALPAVGDWVVLRPPQGDGRATIAAVLPRRTKLSRKVAEREARGAGARRQRRRDLPGHVPQPRAQASAPRALPGHRLGERRLAGHPAHEERPRRRRRRASRRGRVDRVRRARPRPQLASPARASTSSRSTSRTTARASSSARPGWASRR